MLSCSLIEVPVATALGTLGCALHKGKFGNAIAGRHVVGAFLPTPESVTGSRCLPEVLGVQSASPNWARFRPETGKAKKSQLSQDFHLQVFTGAGPEQRRSPLALLRTRAQPELVLRPSV